MSTSAPRHKRVTPQQDAPIRNSLTSRGKAWSAAPPNETPGGTLREALECGVRTAYTVIDDYMRRGYEAARSTRDNPNNGGPMNDNRGNTGNWSNPWGPMSAPMEQWMSAVRMWTDMWTQFIPGGRPGAWPGMGPQGWSMGGMGYPTPGPAAPVSVRVSSLRPAEVTASLMPGSEYLPLTADVPRLNGVSIVRDAGRVCVNLHVSADQPAGMYHGKIKSDGRDVGSLTVTIAEFPGQTS